MAVREDPRMTLLAAHWLSQPIEIGRAGSYWAASVIPSRTPPPSISKTEMSPRKSHEGRCVWAVMEVCESKRTAPTCPQPDASVHTMSGGGGRKVTRREIELGIAPIHLGVTSGSSGFIECFFAAENCRCEKAERWERPNLPNMSVLGES